MVALLAIFAIIEVFDKSRYLGNGMTAGLLVEYLSLKVPFMIGEFMPVIILIAASIHTSELSHHHELAAMRAAGLNITKLLYPLLAGGLLAALFVFALNEWVTPITNQRLDKIEKIHIQHKSENAQGIQWLKDGQYYFRLTPLTDQSFAMMVLQTDPQGHWLKRMDAARATYTQGQWQLKDVYISEPSTSEGMSLYHEEQLLLASGVGPDTADPPSPRHMRFHELYGYAENLQKAGLNADGFTFSLHRKLAAPLACLIMIVLAVALSANMGSRMASASLGMVGAICLGLLFYVLANASGMLSVGNHFPAAYAAWLPDLVFAGLAGFLLMHREEHR